MANFDINNLVVLHLYNYMRPRGEKDPLAQVEKACQVVKLSTCMRTIYVLNKDALKSEEQQKAYESLVAFIERKDMYSASTKFETLEGSEAYQFLLYWIIGGVNPTKTFQDARILGDVREIWTKLCASPSPRAKALVSLYSSLFNGLFSDSVQLRKLIPIYESLEQAPLARTLKTACINCTWARVQGFLGCLVSFDYQSFAENTYLVQLEESLTTLHEKLLVRTKVPEGEEALQSIAAEQQRAGIRKRLLDIEQLLLVLNSLKPKPALHEVSAEGTISVKDKTSKGEDSEQTLLSTSLEVSPSGGVSFFINFVQKQAEQVVSGLSLSVRD